MAAAAALKLAGVLVKAGAAIAEGSVVGPAVSEAMGSHLGVVALVGSAIGVGSSGQGVLGPAEQSTAQKSLRVVRRCATWDPGGVLA